MTTEQASRPSLVVGDFQHISETFALNERMFPDIMEPWSVMLAEAKTDEERVSVMRSGLARTIRQRYPLPGELGGVNG